MLIKDPTTIFMKGLAMTQLPTLPDIIKTLKIKIFMEGMLIHTKIILTIPIITLTKEIPILPTTQVLTGIMTVIPTIKGQANGDLKFSSNLS